MMQNMQSCMGMMHQMMQGRMGQGGTPPGQMGPGGMQTTPAQPTAASASTKAYLEAAEKMHAPMMQGMQALDPDAAFVRGNDPAPSRCDRYGEGRFAVRQRYAGEEVGQ